MSHAETDEEIMQELENTDENGFHPVIIGTLRNFLPDYFEDDSDADIVEMYERKVFQEQERQYRDLLNYNYMSHQLDSANERLSDIVFQEMEKKTLEDMLSYNPYGNRYLLYLVRCSHDCMNSLVLFDLDGAEHWENGPKKRLEIASLIREARDHLALGIIGFPEYLFRAAGRPAKTDVIIDIPSIEKSDSPYYRRIVRRIDPESYEKPIGTWHWDRVRPQDRHRLGSRFDNLSLSLWAYERRLEFVQAFESCSELGTGNPIIELLSSPCSHESDEGELSQFAEGGYPDDFDKRFQAELETAIGHLKMIYGHEPLESRSIGELEYIAYLLAGCKDKAEEALKDATGKNEL